MKDQIKIDVLDLYNKLILLTDSGELSPDEKEFTEDIMTILTKYYETLGNSYKNLVVGSFSLFGRHDFRADEVIELEIGGVRFPIQVSPKETMTKSLESKIKQIINGKLLFCYLNIDTILDKFSFSFAGVTNNVQVPSDEISMYAGIKKYTFGSYNLNKAYLKHYPGHIPLEIFNYPLKGFSFDYNLTEDPVKYLQIAADAIVDNGDLADMRAFGNNFKPLVELQVEKLKQKKCKIILTQWKKYRLQPNGFYI